METHTSQLAKAIEQFQGKVLPLSIFNQLLSILDKVEDSKHAVQLLNSITRGILEVSISSNSAASETATITLNIDNAMVRDWLVNAAGWGSSGWGSQRIRGYHTVYDPMTGVMNARPYYGDNTGTVTINPEDWSNITVANNASPYYTVNITGDPWAVCRSQDVLSTGIGIDIKSKEEVIKENNVDSNSSSNK